MPDVVKFVRQLGHDLRNHLGAVELQAAYIGEIAEDPGLKEEVKRKVLRDNTVQLFGL